MSSCLSCSVLQCVPTHTHTHTLNLEEGQLANKHTRDCVTVWFGSSPPTVPGELNNLPLCSRGRWSQQPRGAAIYLPLFSSHLSDSSQLKPGWLGSSSLLSYCFLMITNSLEGGSEGCSSQSGTKRFLFSFLFSCLFWCRCLLNAASDVLASNPDVSTH